MTYLDTTPASWDAPYAPRKIFPPLPPRMRSHKPLPPLTEYEPEDLPEYSEIVSYEVGQENFYFTLTDGSDGYAKIL